MSWSTSEWRTRGKFVRAIISAASPLRAAETRLKAETKADPAYARRQIRNAETMPTSHFIMRQLKMVELRSNGSCSKKVGQHGSGWKAAAKYLSGGEQRAALGMLLFSFCDGTRRGGRLKRWRPSMSAIVQ